jgi:DNA-nicking Smr family endonuclease
VSAAGAVSAAVVARSTGTAPADDAAFAPPPPVAGASLVDPILRAEQLRAEAHALKLNRDHHYRDSQAAFARGDGAAAKLASDRRKQTQQRIEALRAQAATVLFAHYNHGRPLNEIDLHGLYVEEALIALRTRINACEKRLRTAGSLTNAAAGTNGGQAPLPSVHLLVVIVGRGNHSRDKIAKLRPAVEELIRTHRLRVHADTPNDGCLTIEFGSKEPSGWVGRITEACAIM